MKFENISGKYQGILRETKLGQCVGTLLSANKLSLDVKEMHQMILTKIDSYEKTDNIEYQWAANYSSK